MQICWGYLLFRFLCHPERQSQSVILERSPCQDPSLRSRITGRGAAKNLDWDCHPAQDDTRGKVLLRLDRRGRRSLQKAVCACSGRRGRRPLRLMIFYMEKTTRKLLLIRFPCQFLRYFISPMGLLFFLRVLLNAIRDLFCGDLDALLGEVDVVGADVGGDVGIDG